MFNFDIDCLEVDSSFEEIVLTQDDRFILVRFDAEGDADSAGLEVPEDRDVTAVQIHKVSGLEVKLALDSIKHSYLQTVMCGPLEGDK